MTCRNRHSSEPRRSSSGSPPLLSHGRGRPRRSARRLEARRCRRGISPSLVLRTLVQLVQRPCEGQNSAALLGSEPDRGTFLPSIVSGERRERHEAAALQIKPAPSMRSQLRTLLVPLDPQQLFEVDWPALCIGLLGGVIRTRRELGVLPCAITSPSPRGIVRKNPRQQRQVAGPVLRRHDSEEPNTPGLYFSARDPCFRKGLALFEPRPR